MSLVLAVPEGAKLPSRLTESANFARLLVQGIFSNCKLFLIHPVDLCLTVYDC